jgi:hypothetical protein
MAGMGFDPENAAAALKQTHNNLEQALEMLISGFAAAKPSSPSSSSSSSSYLSSFALIL